MVGLSPGPWQVGTKRPDSSCRRKGGCFSIQGLRMVKLPTEAGFLRRDGSSQPRRGKLPHLTVTCRGRVGDYTWKAMGPGRPSRASPSLCDLDRSLPSPLNCPCSACWLRPGHRGFRSEQGRQGPGPRDSPFWEQEIGTRSLMNDQVMRAGGNLQPRGLVCRVGVSWRGQPPGGAVKSLAVTLAVTVLPSPWRSWGGHRVL